MREPGNEAMYVGGLRKGLRCSFIILVMLVRPDDNQITFVLLE